MADNDYLYQRLGDVPFPVFDRDVADAPNAELYTVCDPATDLLLALFKAAINHELAHHQTSPATDSAWYKARVGTSLSAAMPVADTLYQQPTKQVMRAAKWGFPLLCIYRVEAVDDQATLYKERTVWTWGVDYIMGELTIEDQRKLGAALVYVHHLLHRVIEQQGHPAYQSGAVQFGTGKGGFDSIRLTKAQLGAAEFGEQGEGLIMHALHLDLETVETADPTAEDAPLAGMSLSLGLGGGEGTIPDALQLETEHPGEKLDSLDPPTS